MGVLEEAREDLSLELVRVGEEEGLSVRRPAEEARVLVVGEEMPEL